MAVYTTIDNPELYFQTKVYTSDGGDDTAITYDGSEDMAPNLVWIKDQSSATSSYVCDSVRGSTKRLRSDGTNAEATETTAVKSFGSDGYTLGTHGAVNSNTSVYATWNWKESATAGFDIVSYTGNGTDDTDISHSLSAVPHVIIVKNLAATQPWRVQHKALGETYGSILNDATAKDDDATAWSDEAPTSSVFTLGTSANTNNNAQAFIAYLWSEKQGFSKFGSYTGNGNVDGSFIYTGFRPAWFMTKRTDSANSWNIFDNKRDPHNEVVNHLLADDAGANESGTSDSDVDFCSNGIKIREDNNGVNASGGIYIYMAFAEQPFVNSNGVPCNAR